MLLPLLILIITVSFSFASIESEFNHDFLTKINQENSLTRTEVRRTEKMGRGVYATTDIERDDVLFTVRTLYLQSNFNIHTNIIIRYHWIMWCVSKPYKSSDLVSWSTWIETKYRRKTRWRCILSRRERTRSQDFKHGFL